MGCLLQTFTNKRPTGIECLHQIQAVDGMLQEMINKYERQYNDLDAAIKDGLRNREEKQVLMHKLRRKKVVLHYINVCHKKIDALVQKRCQIEQLNITKHQLDAMKMSVQVFKQFTKENSVEKIESLHDSMVELTEQILDVNSTLHEATPLIDFDEDELESELDELTTATSMPLDVALPRAPSPPLDNSFPVEVELTHTESSRKNIERQPMLQRCK